MLCQKCQSSLQSIYDGIVENHRRNRVYFQFKKLHPTLQSLYLSIATGCFICRRIWVSSLNPQHGGPPDHFNLALEGDIPTTYEEFLDRCGKPLLQSYIDIGVYLHLSEGHFGALLKYESVSNLTESKTGISTVVNLEPTPEIHYPTGSHLNADSPSTAENADLWRHWLHTCLESHTKCRQAEWGQGNFIPDRLIHILPGGDKTDIKWHLVCFEGVRNDRIQYCTLSHRWGSHQPLELTSNEYANFLEVSDGSRLPKTYQDAMRVTLEMGYQYIWIDSLCIIQDDENDWESQSSMMGSIYSSARCNIAAAWALDSTHGCFNRGDRAIVDNTTVKLIDEHGQHINCQVYFPVVGEMRGDPLNQRAWVVQERYLAKRQLSFSKRQVFWECLELSACEQYPTGAPSSAQRANIIHLPEKPTVRVQNGFEFRRSWDHLVEFYSGCQLTRESDRLIALAGLVERFQDVVPDEYLAGLWKKDLIRQLCWRPDYNPDTEERERHRIPTYVAPTWSWASLYAPVLLDKWYLGNRDEEYKTLVQVIEASAESSDPKRLRSFMSSKLVLRGITVRARSTGRGDAFRTLYDIWFDKELQHHSEFKTPVKPPTTREIVSVTWDQFIPNTHTDPEWKASSRRVEEERRGNILFIFLYHRRSTFLTHLCGLVLKESRDPTSRGSYVRIGAFRIGDSPKGHLLKRIESSLTRGTMKHVVDRQDPRYDFIIDLDRPELADLVHEVTII